MGKLEIPEARSFSTPSWPSLRPQVLDVIQTVKKCQTLLSSVSPWFHSALQSLVTHKQNTPQLPLKHIKTQQLPKSLCQKFSFIPIPRNPIFSRWPLHSTNKILSDHSYGNLGREKEEGGAPRHPHLTAFECHRPFKDSQPLNARMNISILHIFQLCWNMSLRCQMLPGFFPELPEVRSKGGRRNV